MNNQKSEIRSQHNEATRDNRKLRRASDIQRKKKSKDKEERNIRRQRKNKKQEPRQNNITQKQK